MSPDTALILQTVIAAVSVIASVTVSAFISGTRWGTMQQEMRTMSDRLTKIEAMFTLTLRDGQDERH